MSEAGSASPSSELEHASDRAAAIVGAAYLDRELADAIRCHFKNLDPRLAKRLFEGYGPLSSFNAKIDLAHALGILSDADYGDLHIIRGIRNAFAHSAAHIPFTEQAIADKCRALSTSAGLSAWPPREQYQGAVIGIWSNLNDYVVSNKSAAGGEGE